MEDQHEDLLSITVSQADFIDLSSLVHRLRRRVLERSEIPKHSGKASSKVRRANRKRRRELTDEIAALEREIVSWSLMWIPVEEEDIDSDVGDPLYDPEDEDTTQPAEEEEDGDEDVDP